MKVVIIGGVAGGASCAARLRRLDERAQIVVIERSGYVSYANCGLPYYVGGVIEDETALAVQTPESLRRRFAIDVRVRQEALRIDRAARTVLVRRLDDGGEYEEAYDRLVLATGALPVLPDVPGAGSPHVFTLRTVEDALALRRAVERQGVSRALVVGGGFVGLECAENLARRGMAVTVVQRGSHVLPTLDDDMAGLVHAHLRRSGVNLLLNARVERLDEADGGVEALVRCGSGAASAQPGVARSASAEPSAAACPETPGATRLRADVVVLAVGVTPDTRLARETGLELGLRGSVKVDAHMRTSDPAIYAVGDAVEVTSFASGRPALIALAGPANRQGRLAADAICGRNVSYRGSQGSSVIGVFGLTVASTGLTCRAARQAGLDFDYAVISAPSHATYYPGASGLTCKLVFERPGGRVLGAQVVGRQGADKRVGVIACAMRAGMTTADLAELDLAYAPPYSSAKDPVNVLGCVAENVLDGLVDQAHWDDVERDVLGVGGPARADVALLDVRTDGEYARGHLPGALHVPLDELRGRLSELPAGKLLYVHCQSGLRSYLACRILAQNGVRCANVAGGYGFYAASRAGDPPQEREGRPAGPCGMPA